MSVRYRLTLYCQATHATAKIIVMKTLLLIPFLFIAGSCSLVAKKIYGIKNPEVESRESIMQYARSVGLDTSAIVTVDSPYFIPAFKRIQSSVPEAEIFSKNGENLLYKNVSTDCNAGLFYFIPRLRTDTVYAKKDSFSLKEQLASLRDLNGKTISPAGLENADYFLFIYWTRWTGKLNKDHVKEWEKLAASNKNVRIRVFEINLDFQNWWSDSFTQKIITAMSGKNKRNYTIHPPHDSIDRSAAYK